MSDGNGTSIMPREEQIREKARNELNETEENRGKGIKYLNHLITSETKLFFPKEDTEFLVRFLRWSKWDYRKAFDRLTTYYNHRKERAEDYERYKPSNQVDHLNNQKILILLPKRNRRDGSSVFYFDYTHVDPNQLGAVGEVTIYLMLFLLHRLMDDPQTQVNGLTTVVHFKDFSPRHLTLITPSLNYFIAHVMVRCLPLRIKGIHIVSPPPLFETLNKIFTPIMPAKIRRRYFLHDGTYESLIEHVDRDALPEEVGGNLKDLDYVGFGKDMLDWEETHWNKQWRYGNRPAK